MQKIVLATNNPHKASEIREILKGIPFQILTGSDFLSFPDPDETGATLEENARIKAVEIHRATGLWALADDSGLEIDALDGAPGVISARFAGPGCTFLDNCLKVLDLMMAIPDDLRSGRFRCVAALAKSESDVTLFSGEVMGSITREMRGDGGFGYDPIFYVPELGCTFAEASPADKNLISHRGRAFVQVARHLES